MMRFGAITGVALSLAVYGAAADQTISLKPDGVAKAFLSTSEQTRIHVVGDRIRRMLAPPEGFEVLNDAETGDVYLNPLPVQGGAGRSATYLITERGHTVQLRFTARDKPADQVMITVETGAAPVPVAGRTVRNAPYVDELVSFVRHVIRGERPGGVEVRSALNNPFKRDQRIEAIWETPRFVAEVVRVRASGAPRQISESDFLETGVAAIWIGARSLEEGSQTRVIIVRLRG